ncbi:MAG TPA: hypothetical protein VGM74_02710 [Burkholderiaceae bacterium]|jgi:hypothetical protein
MKEYRLAAWPQLRHPFDKTAYRRMLSNMSHRHMSLAQLAECSGIRRHQVRQFVEMLGERGLVAEREVSEPDSLFDSLRPLGGWIKRAISAPLPSRD